MLIPKELLRYYKKVSCPRCKSSLSIDDITIFKWDGELSSIAWCKQDPEHYEIRVGWKHDPKHLFLDMESIDLITEDKQYTIRKYYDDNDIIKTQILIRPLDNIYDENIFWIQKVNLNLKLNQNKLISKINTLLLFM